MMDPGRRCPRRWGKSEGQEERRRGSTTSGRVTQLQEAPRARHGPQAGKRQALIMSKDQRLIKVGYEQGPEAHKGFDYEQGPEAHKGFGRPEAHKGLGGPEAHAQTVRGQMFSLEARSKLRDKGSYTDSCGLPRECRRDAYVRHEDMMTGVRLNSATKNAIRQCDADSAK
jgi:hypothetical protein